MIVLAVETATKNCSVGLFDNGKLIAARSESRGLSHAEKLHTFIQEVLQNSGKSFKELNAVAISAGPGSYTGLRIGLSAVKGLCFALDIPLIEISTLENMAHAMKLYLAEQNSELIERNDIFFCPMIDARRMEVYSMLLDHNLKGLTEPEPVIVDTNEEWMEHFKNKSLIYFGDGGSKCREILDKFEDNHFIERESPFATAESMGNLILQKCKRGEFVDTAYYEPNYLKEFKATTPKKLL